MDNTDEEPIEGLGFDAVGVSYSDVSSSEDEYEDDAARVDRRPKMTASYKVSSVSSILRFYISLMTVKRNLMVETNN